MKTIMYQVEVKFFKDDKEVKLLINASSSQDLFKKLKDVIGEKSKWSITKLFNQPRQL